MKTSVVVLNGCIKLLFTIRKEYKILCDCGTLPSCFYSMGDYIEHWINHHKTKLSWFSSLSKNRHTGMEKLNYCLCPENHPALIFDSKSRSFQLECNACEERNTFDSVENFILHFLENHREDGAQNIDNPIVEEGTSKEEFTLENMSADISEVEQNISGMECSDPVESVEPIEQSNNEVFPQQINSIELSDENESSKAISSEHLSYCAEILNVGQTDSIKESQEVDNRVELERLTNRNVEMDIESPPIDNPNIVEQTQSSVENRDEIKLEAKSTAQDLFLGNETNIETATPSRVRAFNFGQNIFGATVVMERLEVNRSRNVNVNENEKNPLSNEQVPGTEMYKPIPNSLSNEIQNAPDEASPSLGIASTRNEIESASTSVNASIRSRPSPPSSNRRKRKLIGETELDGGQGNFRRPRKMSRSSQDPICCPICSKFFSQMQSYHFHMKKFHPPTLCTLCNKDFKDTNGIMQHLNTHRNEVNCPICHEDPNLWCNKLHLKKHFHFLNCRKCDFFTADEVALQTHQIVCGQFRCDLCNAIFGDARAFRQHAFAYHENSEPFECVHCCQKFKFLNGMRTHQRMCALAEDN